MKKVNLSKKQVIIFSLIGVGLLALISLMIILSDEQASFSGTIVDCYQEQVDTVTTCGSEVGGSYDNNYDYNDGDWNTYESISSYYSVVANWRYKIPANMDDAEITIKFRKDNSISTIDRNIPSACLTGTYLEFTDDWEEAGNSWTHNWIINCLDSSSNPVEIYTLYDANNIRFYEEGMTWGIINPVDCWQISEETCNLTQTLQCIDGFRTEEECELQLQLDSLFTSVEAIDELQDSVDDLSSTVVENDILLNQTVEQVANNTAGVEENRNNILFLIAGFFGFGERISANEEAIANNSALIQANADAIEQNGLDIDANGDLITANGQLIIANGDRIDANELLINANGDLITANGLAITNNGNLIQANSILIQANADAIASNGLAITSNGDLIASNGLLISANGDRIDANEILINANGDLITANGVAITNNGNLIANNTMYIDSLGNELDAQGNRITTNENAIISLWNRIWGIEAVVNYTSNATASMIADANNRISDIEYESQQRDSELNDSINALDERVTANEETISEILLSLFRLDGILGSSCWVLDENYCVRDTVSEECSTFTSKRDCQQEVVCWEIVGDECYNSHDSDCAGFTTEALCVAEIPETEVYTYTTVETETLITDLQQSAVEGNYSNVEDRIPLIDDIVDFWNGFWN